MSNNLKDNKYIIEATFYLKSGNQFVIVCDDLKPIRTTNNKITGYNFFGLEEELQSSPQYIDSEQIEAVIIRRKTCLKDVNDYGKINEQKGYDIL